MKTFSSGARINCIVFLAKTAMYSSLALPEISSYALLYSAIKMFKRTIRTVHQQTSSETVMEGVGSLVMTMKL